MDSRFLLDTKLHMPSVRLNHIRRDILNKKLDEGLDKEHKLFIVSAPAGYGKTTLISGWLSRLDYNYTWLSLDEYDNDPLKFISYLLATVRKINKRFGTMIEDLLAAPKLPSVETVSLYMARELEQVQEPFILVFDDYHVINNAYINELLQKLLDSIAPRLVLITRKEPSLAFSRWRVEDKITELNSTDLKFTSPEISGFFSRYFNLDFDDDMLKIVEKQTEGWAAGMQLTGLSIKNMEKARAKSFMKELNGNNRFIADYLMDEVLKSQEEQIRIFLNRTCTLKKFNGELCEAVTGIKDSRKIIKQLEKDNLFIVPLDDTYTWYRYHHLFSEFLRMGLNEDLKAEMCRKASLWCRENGFTEAALEYALEARDGEAAANLVKDKAMELFQKGELKTLLSWLNSVSAIKKEKEGILEVYRAWCLLITGEINEANQVIDSLEYIEESSNDPIILGMAKASAPFRYKSEDKEQALKDAEEGLSLVKDKQELFYYGGLIALGHANGLNGHTRKAEALHAKVYEGARRKGYRFLEVTSLHDVAFYLNCMGKRREALTLCERTLERLTDHGGNHLPMAKIVYLPVGMLLYCANKLEEAQKYLEEGIASYQEVGFAHLGGLGEWYLVLLLYSTGEKEKAFEMAYRLKAYYKDFIAYRITVFFEALEMELFLREGNIERVSMWLKEPGITFDKISGISDINPYFTYIRALIAQKDCLKAQTALEEKEELVRKEGRYGELITVLLLSALVKKHLGREAEALVYVREAVTLAAPEGYARYFIDEGSELLELASKVRDMAPEFIDKLFGKETKKIYGQTDLLRKREIEILLLIAEGLSNDEIAVKLFITTGTAKWHINNIFSKLEVNKRTQAVDKARRLNIIS
ncbi:LuxR C-terminal-related transcriptional regulator [Desulfosporosinus hippei]|uniref:LuxR family transcriptional regulator, maltose regulon positive regulatory protein n=1 Tax=Desulfosporosinus hippei DSM 8344 TaxID=1121419 RepID=A0A1G8K5C7_9FIRM|nr:LuxR C-terminal-related transcriptional regulator [Desulfosporosinus hippei]SDI38638.1 LuxR family transcriptional regulator, maltose regulon positive regulatory protein [Desulfosporosinus hippei DSM 8344]